MIDLIIPVYGALEATRRCLDSVLAWPQRQAFTVIVVEDASPQPEMRPWLESLARERRILLLINERNRGFVHSVNRGMAEHPERDVLLLNSDTEVANDWLDRLHRAASRNPRTGTVTPFSNQATICSYPYEGWEGGLPGPLGLAALDRLFARCLDGQSLEIPTAVGFCLYLRRACLNEVGPFDEETFGRGYGEENDFCLRAAARGWHHLLACDTFVFHAGATSFGGERASRTQAAQERLLARHPQYDRLVQAFIQRDPVAAARTTIDRARLRLGGEEADAVLDEQRDRLKQGQRRLEQWQHWLEQKQHDLETCQDQYRQLERAYRQLADQAQTLETAMAHELGRIAEFERQIGQRDAAIAALNGQITLLDQGLQQAESLAFARAEELHRIQSFRLWRTYRLALERWG